MSRNQQGWLIGLKARKGFLQFIFCIIPGEPLVNNYLVIFLNCSMHFQIKEEDRISDSCIHEEVTVGTIYFGFFIGKNNFSNLRGKLLGRIL